MRVKKPEESHESPPEECPKNPSQPKPTSLITSPVAPGPPPPAPKPQKSKLFHSEEHLVDEATGPIIGKIAEDEAIENPPPIEEAQREVKQTFRESLI